MQPSRPSTCCRAACMPLHGTPCICSCQAGGAEMHTDRPNRRRRAAGTLCPHISVACRPGPLHWNILSQKQFLGLGRSGGGGLPGLGGGGGGGDGGGGAAGEGGEDSGLGGGNGGGGLGGVGGGMRDSSAGQAARAINWWPPGRCPSRSRLHGPQGRCLAARRAHSLLDDTAEGLGNSWLLASVAKKAQSTLPAPKMGQ